MLFTWQKKVIPLAREKPRLGKFAVYEFTVNVGGICGRLVQGGFPQNPGATVHRFIRKILALIFGRTT
ncbi:hypothetical protein [Amaricoccus tamworthensis]|uniref:hypothetical protein n=1 Tax=Amaricoccus tamworthensis TaxID=57002 RepID=UPI003C7ED7A4